MSGELIFTFGFGGALIVMGVIVHLFLNKMEQPNKEYDAEKIRTKKDVS